MRSATPSPRRLRSRAPRHDPLAAVAQMVDATSVDDPGHVLIHLQEPRTEVVLGLRPFPRDTHPFDVLAGVTAPADWWAFGIRARGRAHHVDHPGQVTEGVATTFLVDREGNEASVLRAGGVVTPLHGPAQGTIADVCRRVLGVPTPSPPTTADVLWATRWLDAILSEWGQPHRRRVVASGLGALTALHPASEGEEIADVAAFAARAIAHARRWDWRALRLAPEPLALPDGAVAPEIARWMDDGFYARWTLGAYPPLTTLLADLCGLLGAERGQELLEAVVSSLGDGPPPP